MLDKLKNLAQTFTLLEEQLCDPSVIEDSNQFKEINKKHKELKPIMAVYEVYTSYIDRRDQAQEMLNNADMCEMAQEELNEIEPKIAALEIKINSFLTPQNINIQEDAKDALSFFRNIREDSNSCFEEQRPVAKENGRSFTLEVFKEEKYCKIHVDGCLITDNNQQRCDYWFHHYDKNDNVFVELKGADLNHAIEQIIETIEWLKIRIELPKPKRNGAIVLSRNPLTSTETQKIQMNFRKNHGNRLEIKNGQMSFKFKEN